MAPLTAADMAAHEDAQVPNWIKNMAQDRMNALGVREYGFVLVLCATYISLGRLFPDEVVLDIMAAMEPMPLYRHMFREPGEPEYSSDPYNWACPPTTPSAHDNVSVVDSYFNDSESDSDDGDAGSSVGYVDGSSLDSVEDHQECIYKPGYYDVLQLDEEL